LLVIFQYAGIPLIIISYVLLSIVSNKFLLDEKKKR
jgi:CDP-diacylglycerol--serine O-phosphatidyltransferase